MARYLEVAEEIAAGTVAENAVEVDRDASFPRASMDALRESGLMGLINSKEVGGMGEGPRAATLVVERLARECGSTAMVLCMHYTGAAVVEAFGSKQMRQEIAGGEHLMTIAFSEQGSRSHFWAPVSTAGKSSGGVRLDAQKSWVTSANHATAYVWSSQPVSGNGPSTIWLVPRESSGLSTGPDFDGLGLRGNDSTSVRAEGVLVPEDHRLGDDGKGFDVMMEAALPHFNVMSTGVAVGLMEGAVTASCDHASGTVHQHLGSSLADLPTIRSYLARMRVATDQARCLLLDTLDAIENGREDTLLRVLECKAAAGEAATQVLDTAMRVCGGAAFRKEVGVERRFRDARAGTIMAPTTDQLYDFIGKAVCGMPVF